MGPRGSSASGAIMALVAKNEQDSWNESHNKLIHDARRHMLQGRCQMVYGRMECKVAWSLCKGCSCATFSLTRGHCDLVSCVDLVLPPGVQLADVASVEVAVGAETVDALVGHGAGGVETQLRASCALLGRCVTQWPDGCTIAALPLAPLHRHNLVPPAMTNQENGELAVRVLFSTQLAPADRDAVALHGDMYFVEDRPRHLGFNYGLPAGKGFTAKTSMMTLKHQQASSAPGAVEKPVRIGAHDRLGFSDPVALLYFHGVRPIERVTNVSLHLNGQAFYDGGVLPLVHRTRAMLLDAGYPADSMPSDAVVLTFVPGLRFSRRQCGSINFSRIDDATLTLRIRDAAPEDQVHVVALSYKVVLMNDGALSVC